MLVRILPPIMGYSWVYLESSPHACFLCSTQCFFLSNLFQRSKAKKLFLLALQQGQWYYISFKRPFYRYPPAFLVVHNRERRPTAGKCPRPDRSQHGEELEQISGVLSKHDGVYLYFFYSAQVTEKPTSPPSVHQPSQSFRGCCLSPGCWAPFGLDMEGYVWTSVVQLVQLPDPKWLTNSKVSELISYF